jgi:hypothetical protein
MKQHRLLFMAVCVGGCQCWSAARRCECRLQANHATLVVRGLASISMQELCTPAVIIHPWVLR